MPLPYNARLEVGVLFILKSSVFICFYMPGPCNTQKQPGNITQNHPKSIILEATAPCRTIFIRK